MNSYRSCQVSPSVRIDSTTGTLGVASGEISLISSFSSTPSHCDRNEEVAGTLGMDNTNQHFHETIQELATVGYIYLSIPSQTLKDFCSCFADTSTLLHLYPFACRTLIEE
jgi:hypothetical protein